MEPREPTTRDSYEAMLAAMWPAERRKYEDEMKALLEIKPPDLLKG